MNIKEFRTKIDKIDSDILQLLDERMDFVHEIGLIKSASKESVYRPEREKEIIERLSALSKGKLNPESIQNSTIFNKFKRVSKDIQKLQNIFKILSNSVQIRCKIA